MHRRRFAYASVVVLVALLSGACTGGGTPTPGITSSITAPSPVAPTPPAVDPANGDFQVVSNQFIPDSGATLHAQDSWYMKQVSWCSEGMHVGPVLIRDDGQRLVGTTTKLCDGGSRYMNFQIKEIVDQRMLNFSAGHRVVVKVATVTSLADWDNGQVTFRDVPEVVWNVQ